MTSAEQNNDALSVSQLTSQLHAGHADKVAHALLQEALGRLGVLDGVDGDNGHIHGSLDGLVGQQSCSVPQQTQ